MPELSTVLTALSPFLGLLVALPVGLCVMCWLTGIWDK